MTSNKSYKQLKQISTATLLEESSHLRLILRGVLVVFAVIALLLIWAAFAKIKETAVTYGELVPKGQVQLVQHLEGGIIKQVLVKDGDQVKKNQILIKMDKTATLAELAQLQGQEITLILDVERLRAYIKGQSVDVLKWSEKVINSKYNTVKNKLEIQKLLAAEKNALAAQNKSRMDQQATLKYLIEQRKEKLKQAMNEKKVWSGQVKLLMEQFNMYKKLREGNYVSHKDYLILLREVNKAKGEVVRLNSLILQTQQSISESENKLKELDSDLKEKAFKELGVTDNKLVEVRHKIEKLEDKLARLDVRSPVAGLVKGLRVYPGNVVQPGGLLLEVVPLSEELIVESRVKPRDIGHVKVGDPVTVKILTYDFARYGSIKGTLTKLSASTFNDKEGNPYYKATTTIKQQYVSGKEGKKKLIPGMTVEANVVTGEKTLLQYILKPIKKSTSTAFQER